MKTHSLFKFFLSLFLFCMSTVVKSDDYDQMYRLILVENSGGKLIKSVEIHNDLSLTLQVYYNLTIVRIDYYQNGIIKTSKTYSKNEYNNNVIVPIALTNRFVISASYYAVNSDSAESIIQGGNYHTMIYEIELAH